MIEFEYMRKYYALDIRSNCSETDIFKAHISILYLYKPSWSIVPAKPIPRERPIPEPSPVTADTRQGL